MFTNTIFAARESLPTDVIPRLFLMLLVTMIQFPEVRLEAVVSSAIKEGENTSNVALVYSFVALIAAEKTHTLKRGVCHSAEVQNNFKSVYSKILTSATSFAARWQ